MNTFYIIQAVLAVLLIVAVLMQNRGSSLGSAFGSGSEYFAKRGFEKFLSIATIVLAIGLVLCTVFLVRGGW